MDRLRQFVPDKFTDDLWQSLNRSHKRQKFMRGTPLACLLVDLAQAAQTAAVIR